MNNTDNNAISDRMIQAAETIRIISGEGENGTIEDYTGKRTARAVRAKLTHERHDGDRWGILVIDGQRI
jgi:hypothetical protein